MRIFGLGRIPRGGSRRTFPVQALREPAVSSAVRPELDYLGRWDIGGGTAASPGVIEMFMGLGSVDSLDWCTRPSREVSGADRR